MLCCAIPAAASFVTSGSVLGVNELRRQETSGKSRLHNSAQKGDSCKQTPDPRPPTYSLPYTCCTPSFPLLFHCHCTSIPASSSFGPYSFLSIIMVLLFLLSIYMLYLDSRLFLLLFCFRRLSFVFCWLSVCFFMLHWLAPSYSWVHTHNVLYSRNPIYSKSVSHLSVCFVLRGFNSSSLSPHLHHCLPRRQQVFPPWPSLPSIPDHTLT